jgi:hypothetical protein
VSLVALGSSLCLGTHSKLNFVIFGYLFYRYALQLLTPASIIAKMSGRNQIDVQDIGEMNSLFLDAKRSAGVLLEQEGKGAWATYGRR